MEAVFAVLFRDFPGGTEEKTRKTSLGMDGIPEDTRTDRLLMQV
jgi:hypothetical protein